MPGSTAAGGHVAQLPRDSQRDEYRSPTPWCFPLAPEGSPQSQADPASESNQLLGRFAKAEIAAPAQHIPSQFFHCRLDANALGPSRDVSDSLLEPVQRFCPPILMTALPRRFGGALSTFVFRSLLCDGPYIPI